MSAGQISTSSTSNPPNYCAFRGYHIYPPPGIGTPFERTQTPLQMWSCGIYLFATRQHGVSAKTLQRQLAISYKTSWRIVSEIRKQMGKVDRDNVISSHVEVNETYVGGKRPRNWGCGASGKTIVLGMIERDGDLTPAIVPAVKKRTLQLLLAMNVILKPRADQVT